jgi:uroporphyrinogen decarboxylase
MIFDSWGGSLSAAAYQEFSLRYLRRIIDGLIREQDGERVPSIVFTKGGGLWLESIADIGCDAIGVDWTIDIGEARRRVGHRVACRGTSIRACCLPPRSDRREAGKVLASYGADGTGHVFNLGHGISQFTPPENVTALVDAVHTRSRLLRSGTDRKSPQALDLFTETMATSGPPSGSSANPG